MHSHIHTHSQILTHDVRKEYISGNHKFFHHRRLLLMLLHRVSIHRLIHTHTHFHCLFIPLLFNELRALAQNACCVYMASFYADTTDSCILALRAALICGDMPSTFYLSSCELLIEHTYAHIYTMHSMTCCYFHDYAIFFVLNPNGTIKCRRLQAITLNFK